MWFLFLDCFLLLTLLVFTLLVWISGSFRLHRGHARAQRPEGNNHKGNSLPEYHGPRAEKKFRSSKDWGCY